MADSGNAEISLSWLEERNEAENWTHIKQLIISVLVGVVLQMLFSLKVILYTSTQ